MGNNKAEVGVAKPAAAGGFFAAPAGTTLPTSITAALDPAFEGLGLISDAGLVETEARATGDIYDWNGDVIAVTQKTFGKTFTVAFVQYLSEAVQRLARGESNVSSSAATTTHGNQLTIKARSDQLPFMSFVVDMVLGTGGRIRKVAPSGQLTSLDNTDFKADAASTVGGTLTLYPDDDGVYVYTYTDDGQKTVNAGA